MAQTITDAITSCGALADTIGLTVNGNNAVEMISVDVFNENFNTRVNINFSELKYNWKTYSRLTVAEGRIRLRPRTKVNIRACVQYARGEISKDENPILTLFPLAERDDLIERFDTHKLLEGTYQRYLPSKTCTH